MRIKTLIPIGLAAKAPRAHHTRDLKNIRVWLRSWAGRGTIGPYHPRDLATGFLHSDWRVDSYTVQGHPAQETPPPATAKQSCQTEAANNVVDKSEDFAILAYMLLSDVLPHVHTTSRRLLRPLSNRKIFQTVNGPPQS
jgi:hypothetical protein